MTQHFARIHGVCGIERLFQRTHEIELDLGRIALELARLQLADPVLGAETTAERCDQIMDRAPQRRLAREKTLTIRAGREIHIEV